MAHTEYEKITGTVETVIFSNEENGYTVAAIETPEFNFVAVGTMFGIGEGEKVVLTGSWTNHPTYGQQFKTEMYEKCLPTSVEEINKYLSSGILKGVRKATAQKIIERFGEKSLEVIAKEPIKLSQIKGISKDKAISIGESYATQIGTSELFIFLQNFGISSNVCMKIYKKHSIFSKEVIMDNPYILCDSDYGVSFKKADEIAQKNSISPDSQKRICAGLIYTLGYMRQFGHTYLPEKTLIQYASELLGVLPDSMKGHVDYLCESMTFVREKRKEYDAIYLFEYYNYEKYVSEKIVRLAKTRYAPDVDNIEKQIDIAEIKSGLKFAPLQRSAIRLCARESVMVITGGPGTGKTTIINAIIDIMKSVRLKVVLTAPTGRAAKRMSQVCGMEAKTIHRLLEVSFSEGEEINCGFDETNPIDADVIIVDEMSMVDIVLMDSFLHAVRPGTRVILVGDSNQLPSVGPGNVLKDIIDSGVVSVIKLSDIFRQSDSGMIVYNAHEVNQGRYPVCNTENSDFYMKRCRLPEEGVEYICQLCISRLKKTYGYEPFDIQVLSPTKKGIAGVNNLNKVLQKLINPPSVRKREKTYGDTIFREGDKVMQIKNNYDIEWTNTESNYLGSGIFNGDVGYVSEINTDFSTLTVIFDDKKVTYGFSDLSELSLAYSITVHKSQGSEFPVVIMPMFPAPGMLLNRNLFYTGITRAKELVVLVGDEGIMEKMVDNDREDKRYSGLMEKLKDEYTGY